MDSIWHDTARITNALSKVEGSINCSFAILQDSRLVVIAPLVFSPAHGKLVADFAGWGTPRPLVALNLGTKVRSRLEKVAISHIEKLCKQYDVKYLLFCDSRINQPIFNDLTLLNFVDISVPSVIIDLTRKNEVLLSEMRTNHRRDFRKYDNIFRYEFLNKEKEPDAFDEFQDFYHSKTPQRSLAPLFYEGLRDLFDRSNATIVKISHQENFTVGYLFFIHSGSYVYYLLGGSCNEQSEPVLKLGLIKAIFYFSEIGFELFEVGRLEFSPSLVSDTDEKRRSISQFKLGFGGRIVRLSKSLKIFNESLNDSLGYMRLTLND